MKYIKAMLIVLATLLTTKFFDDPFYMDSKAFKVEAARVYPNPYFFT